MENHALQPVEKADSRRRDILWNWALALVGVGLFGIYFHYLIGSAADFAHTNDSVYYLTGAKSIAEGSGYRRVTHEGSPPITLYPPLNSLVLSVAWQPALGLKENFVRLHCLEILIAVAGFATFHLFLAKEGVPRIHAALFTLSLGLSPQWFDLVALYFSEIPFCLLVLGLLLAWQQGRSRGSWIWMLTGIGIAALFLTRTAAIAVIAAMIPIIFLRARAGDRRPALFFFPLVSLAVGGWYWWVTKGRAETYSDIFASTKGQAGGLLGYLIVCGRNAVGYLSGGFFLDTIFPIAIRLPHLPKITSLGLSQLVSGTTFLVGCGFVVLAVRGLFCRRSPFDLSMVWIVGVYLVEMILWPGMGGRGLFPVLVLFLVWFWRGLMAFATTDFAKRTASRGLTIVLSVNVLCNGYLITRETRSLEREGSMSDLREVAAWIRSHVSKESRIAAVEFVPQLQLSELIQRRLSDWRAPGSTAESGNRSLYIVSATSPPDRSLPGATQVHLVNQSSNGKFLVFRTGPD